MTNHNKEPVWKQRHAGLPKSLPALRMLDFQRETMPPCGAWTRRLPPATPK